MGTVFTFGNRYWYSSITENEARYITGTFVSYSKNVKKSQVKEITICFNENERLSIHRCCIDDKLCDAISNIKAGTIIKMKVHPNSDMILEMKVRETQLLEFKESIQKLSQEKTGFLYLGSFCYLMAILGMIEFYRIRKR